MAYTISRTEKITGSYYYLLVRPDGSVSPISGAQTAQYTYLKQGEKVYSWKNRIAAGLSASSGYAKKGLLIYARQPMSGAGQGNADAYGRRGTWTITGFVDLVYVNPLPDVPTNLRYEAERAFINQAYDQINSIEGLPFIAELGKSKRLLQSTASRLLSFTTVTKERADKMIRRNLNTRRIPSALLGALSDLWLEYKFGADPFFKDINDILGEFDNPMPQQARIRVTKHENASDGWDVARSIGACVVTTQAQRAITHTVSYRAGLNLTHSAPKSFGVSASQIPGAIWELTPWSFLVDYFFDISTFLKSAQVANLNFQYATKSEKTFAHTVVQQQLGAIPGTTIYMAAGGQSQYTQHSYIRGNYSPGLFCPTVQLAGALKGLRPANILALVGSRLNPRLFA